MINASIDTRQLKGAVAALDSMGEALEGRAFKRTAEGTIAETSGEEFHKWLRNRAEENHDQLHHVYEWADGRGNLGDERLYRLVYTAGGAGGGGTYRPEFLQSSKPVPLRDPEKAAGFRQRFFHDKANFMEHNSSHTISPHGPFLIWWEESEDSFVAARKVTITYPTHRGFETAWDEFWNTESEGRIIRPMINRLKRAIDRDGVRAVANHIRTSKGGTGIASGIKNKLRRSVLRALGGGLGRGN